MAGLNGYEERAAELTARWQQAIRRRQAEAISRMQPVEVELPDGEPVLAIRAPLAWLLEAGRIPDALTPFVLDMMALGQERGTEDVAEELVGRRQHDFVRLLDAVWLACVVAPRFTLAALPGPDEIALSQVSVADKIALFNWAQGVSDHLASFRAGPGGAARAAPDRQGVRAGSGDAAGDRSPAGSLAGVADPAGDVDLGEVGRRAPCRDAGGAGQPAAPEGANASGAEIHLPAGAGLSRSGRPRGGSRDRRGGGGAAPGRD